MSERNILESFGYGCSDEIKDKKTQFDNAFAYLCKQFERKSVE
jgi:CRISPR/Cas system CMR-associated protein Cmr5 small subunit